MKNVIVIINDIDPNIYLDGLETTDYNIIVVYQKPVSEAMEIKFTTCIEKNKNFEWIKVEKKEQLLDAAKLIATERTIHNIIAFAEDLIIPVEEIKHDFNMKNQYDEIKYITNKYYQRSEVSKSAPELCGDFYLLNKENILKIKEEFVFPGILKPVSMAGSRMVKKIDSFKELEKTFYFLSENKFFDTEFIIETYFEGSQWYENDNLELDNYVSVESIVSNGEITHITISSKPLLSFPFRESGLVTCCPLNEVAKKKIYEAAEKVIKALNFKNGGTHIELKLTKYGPKLLEFNPRLGGPVPYLVQISSDYPIIREVVNSYFGKKILKFPGFYNVGAFFSFQLETKSKSEIIAINKDIPTFNDNYVKEGYIFKNIGDTIDPYGGTSVMLGFAYLIGESISECFKHREKIIKEMGVRAIINEK